MSLFDQYNRKIEYLRISVTDRCNLRCDYCMPETGAHFFDKKEILSYEKLFEVAKKAVSLGITKIRITGGEPLVRSDIVDFVKMIASIDGLLDFGMTTNAIHLDRFAKPLFDAGLHRINISLDSLDPEIFRKTTRGGDVQKVFDGIIAAKAAGFKKLKINCVVDQSRDDGEALKVGEYAKQNGIEVRYIRRMNLEKGEFWVVDGGDGGDCKKCNRIRLTSNGIIRPCLFNDMGFSVKEYSIEDAIKLAVKNKPEHGTNVSTFHMHAIGG